MSNKVHISGLPKATSEKILTEFLEDYGPILSARINSGKAVVVFEAAKNCEEFITAFHGREILGEKLIVKHANAEIPDPIVSPTIKEIPTAPRFRSAQLRVIVTELGENASVQDLKDAGGRFGTVLFADIPDLGSGLIDFRTPQDAYRAAGKMNGMLIRGGVIKAALESTLQNATQLSENEEDDPKDHVTDQAAKHPAGRRVSRFRAPSKSLTSDFRSIIKAPTGPSSSRSLPTGPAAQSRSPEEKVKRPARTVTFSDQHSGSSPPWRDHRRRRSSRSRSPRRSPEKSIPKTGERRSSEGRDRSRGRRSEKYTDNSTGRTARET